jgi:Glutamine amidotransferase class-I
VCGCVCVWVCVCGCGCTLRACENLWQLTTRSHHIVTLSCSLFRGLFLTLILTSALASLQYVPQLEEAGLRFVAQDETGTRMEVVELHEDDHPFFVATQAHPEFKSRPQNPSPFFSGFIRAACKMPIFATSSSSASRSSTEA